MAMVVEAYRPCGRASIGHGNRLLASKQAEMWEKASAASYGATKCRSIRGGQAFRESVRMDRAEILPRLNCLSPAARVQVQVVVQRPLWAHRPGQHPIPPTLEPAPTRKERERIK